MSVLEITEIGLIIDSGRPEWIEIAEKETTKLQVHVNGVGTAEYLSRVEGHENDRQFQLRKNFATSNRYLFENLLRPVDKVFSAKGGNKLYSFSTKAKEKQFRERLSNVDEGLPITKWIENVQANKYYSDPSGLVFFEWTKDETHPTIKSIFSIYNYQKNGRGVDWIIFKPEKRNDKKGKELPGDFYRVVDDEKDVTVYVVDKQITVAKNEDGEPDIFVNPFKKVPAIINSDRINFTLKYNESPIQSTIDLADNYLQTSSTHSIYQVLHGYPIFWAYVQPCKRCDGTGLYDGVPCHSCNGEGHTFSKDVSDIIKLKPPTSTDQPQLAPDVAGYVQPDLGVSPEQRTELGWLSGLMHFTTWGTARQEKADNETATAAFIDSQPVNDALNKYTDGFEGLEKSMTDLMGWFYFGEAYKGSSVNYGRRFLVEPPDIIWKKYETAREKGSPKTTLDYLLNQFYQSEFANDIESLAIAQAGIKLEPFIHSSDEQIDKLPILQTDKLAKYYFNEWFKLVPHEDILMKNTEALIKDFQIFMSNKNIDNARQEA